MSRCGFENLAFAYAEKKGWEGRRERVEVVKTKVLRYKVTPWETSMRIKVCGELEVKSWQDRNGLGPSEGPLVPPELGQSRSVVQNRLRRITSL